MSQSIGEHGEGDHAMRKRKKQEKRIIGLGLFGMLFFILYLNNNVINRIYIWDIKV